METVTNKAAEGAEANETNAAKRYRAAEGVERLLMLIFFTSFILLVLSQAALTDPSIRAAFNRDASDGAVLGSEAYLFEPCKMELKLYNAEYCPELRVMVNGDEREAFWSDTILLELKKGDVVELDASKLLISADIQITAVSGNISELLGKSYTVSGGIVKVAIVV